ncbi:MAG: GNAT family N-acetyltransferase, partial [Planctomycetaceae bacterium]
QPAGTTMTTGARTFGYEIRDCDPGDENQVNQLLGRTVGETHGSRKTSDYWHWKYLSCPFGPADRLCAYVPGSHEVGGFAAMMPWNMRSPDGAVRTVIRCVDTGTSPDHQRKGIFSALIRFSMERRRREGVPFMFGTPNDQSLPGYMKLDWTNAGFLPLYVRPILRPSLVRQLANRHAHPTEDVLRPGATGLTPWSEYRAREPDELARLVHAHESGRRHTGYRTDRTMEYLDWRYGGNPNIAYGVHVQQSNGRPRAIVIGRNTAGIRRSRALIINEMFLEEPSPRNAARLIRTLIASTRADYLLAHFAEGTVERAALRRNAFFKPPRRGYTWITKQLDPPPLDPGRLEHWDLTAGELELF